MLKGNAFIKGNMNSTLKLLEGIREFDMILLSSATLLIDSRFVINKLLELISKGGKLGVKVDPPVEILALKNLLMDFGLEDVHRVNVEQQPYIIFEMKPTLHKEEAENVKTWFDYLQKASSILCMGEDILLSTKTLLSLNHRDQGNRSFVVISDENDSSIYEKVKKYSIIYETPLEQIILESTDSNAAA
ncbi:hypothetical protein JOD82_001870 [Paenibacillus sp. 1182]|uniref:hypothetical protein n=1 Tax=Paenibacillus sp. 1182 TaxID=2806565 RepID=UPI001AEAF93F|nr:hypothetical protein [Paenibacillus sp. 1182]MBP1308850.1 hypothetical protein [Paenibacillus sp. 1182]